MNIRIFVLAMALVISGCASTAGTGAQEVVQDVDTEQGSNTDQVADEKAGDEDAAVAELDPGHPDAMRCKRIKKTGTRFASKVCATNREWEQSEAAARDSVNSIQQRPQYGKDGT